MNSEEGMSLAKMAVSVLLVVLVIGAVVAIVYAAYSWFNSGTAKLSDQVNSIEASAYAQYDDAQCSGTDVLTALKSYRDSDIAIVITNHSGEAKTGYNYCAVIAGNNDVNAAITLNGTVTSQLTVTGLEWDDSTGLAKRNTNFSPTTKKSNGTTYVKQGAQFYSKLIYSEETNEVCGIYFCDYAIWDAATRPSGGNPQPGNDKPNPSTTTQ